MTAEPPARRDARPTFRTASAQTRGSRTALPLSSKPRGAPGKSCDARSGLGTETDGACVMAAGGRLREPRCDCGSNAGAPGGPGDRDTCHGGGFEAQRSQILVLTVLQADFPQAWASD